MTRTECPSCRSESVAWRGALKLCLKCNLYLMPDAKECYKCKGTELTYKYPEAHCSDCSWIGDPYDLIEIEEEDTEDDAGPTG